jgi:hypothetical protein
MYQVSIIGRRAFPQKVVALKYLPLIALAILLSSITPITDLADKAVASSTTIIISSEM